MVRSYYKYKRAFATGRKGYILDDGGKRGRAEEIIRSKGLLIKLLFAQFKEMSFGF